MRWLAVIMALQGAAPASTMLVLRDVVEARAGTAADGEAGDYEAGALHGALRFDSVQPTPDGACRNFILTASDAPEGPFRRFTGEACLAPGSSRWRAVRLRPAETAAPHFPSGLPVVVSKPLHPGPLPIVIPPPHPGPVPIVVPPQTHPGATAVAKPIHHRFQPGALPPPPVETAPSPDTAVPPTPHPPASAAQPPPEMTTAEPPISPEGVAAKLPTYPITYNKPGQLSFDTDTQIALTIRTTGSSDAEMQKLAGDKVTARAHLSDDVVAELTGDPAVVRITPRQDKAQGLADLGDTTWVWDVRALTPDPTSLTLTLSATVTLSGKPTRVPVRTYTDRIPVVMDPVSRIKWWLDRLNPVLKALGLGTPVVVLGALWAFLRRRVAKRGGSTPPPAPPAPAA